MLPGPVEQPAGHDGTPSRGNFASPWLTVAPNGKSLQDNMKANAVVKAVCAPITSVIGWIAVELANREHPVLGVTADERVAVAV